MYLTCKLPNADTNVTKPDFTILCGPDKYPVPKLNAMLCSTVISKRLMENPQISMLKLSEEYNKENLALITDYIWGKPIKITPSNAVQMINLGIEFGSTGIIECSNIIYEAVSTISEIIMYLSQVPYEPYCNFAAKYLQYFLIVDKFSDLPHETINKILDHSYFGLRSGQSLINWLLAYQDKCVKKHNIPKSETYYLFRNVSLNFITNNVERQHFVIEHPEAAKEMKNIPIPYLHLPSGDEEGFRKHITTMITDYTRKIF